ncbi:MAG: S9 family peptidase [Steroidobacteraceae bacterium]|jgi:dipeptidyl aminopeptidase/acylaminoacyl peptidase|nr:S9 family peptidase [Steroidobacteraceae bacterium]
MTRSSLPAFAAGLMAVAALATPTAGAETLTPERIWQLSRPGDPSLSPDGRFAVVPVTTFDVEKNEGATDLYMIPTDGGETRRITTADASDSSPAWSPDGRHIAFVSKRGDDKEPQVYVIATDGGEARRVTQLPVGVAALRWFPDSKRIAFIARVLADTPDWDEMKKRLEEREKSKMKARTWDQSPVSYWDRWLDDRQAHVFAVTLDDGTVAPITLGSGRELSRQEPGLSSYDISPDGLEIAFASNVDTTGTDANFDVFVMPVAGGEPRNITSANPANDGGPRYSPDGRWLVYAEQRIKGFYGDKRRAILVDRRSGQRRELGADWDRSVGSLEWTPDSTALYGAIDDAGTDRIHRITVPAGRIEPVTGSSSFSGVAVAGKPARLVALRQSFSEPPTLVSIAPRDGSARKLSTFNDALLAPVSMGKVESVTYKGAGGADVQMWVVYPPGFDPAKKYPLFLLLHGGPHNGITDSWTFRWNAQVFASWGYVVAWHNFHGSSGFGQDFTDSINPDRISKPYEDTIKAAGWFAAQPWIDAGRMVAGGGSYGGFLASTLLGREHPFKALIAHAAVYNEFTQYGADYGASQRRHFEFWEDPEAFARYSPHTAAANFNTPTLVTHGQLDYRVPVNQGFELFAALQNRGVRSRMIYYPDENHWILKPQNSLHWYEEVRKWIAEFAPPGGAD